MTNLVARVQLSTGDLLTVEHEGEHWVVLKPAIESLGLAWRSQHAKLQHRSWAVVTEIMTTGRDGKRYRMTCCTIDTFLTLLGTINEAKVSDDLRPMLIAYQRETSRAVGAYWTRRQAAQHVESDALRRAEAVAADVERILGNALREVRQVLNEAGIAASEILPAPAIRASISEETHREKSPRREATEAMARRKEIARQYREAKERNPELKQSEFVTMYNRGLGVEEWALREPFLSKLLKEFPPE